MKVAHARLVVFVASLGVAAAQDPTARLEGIVLDPLSHPVANAKVQVEAEGEVIARTQTDAEGAFVVGRLPARVLVVQATTAAPDVGASEVDLDEHAHAFVCVRTMPARRVTGTVRDEQGVALAGAWIACVPTGARELGAVGSHMVSDDTGAFVLPQVPFGHNSLRVWSAGFAGAARDVDGTEARDLAITLSRDDVQELSFELLHANAAQAATARLELTAWNGDAPLLLPPALRAPARGDDGSWWCRGWPDADSLHARLVVADACIEPPLLRVEPDSVRRHRVFYVEDDEDSWLRGRIVDADGAPVAGVRVRAEVRLEARFVGTDTATAADGTFVLRAPAAKGRGLWLRLIDPHWSLVPDDEPPIETDVPQRHRRAAKHARQPLELVATRGVTLRWRQVGADGNRMVHAAIAVLGATSQQVGRGSFRHAGFYYRAAPVVASEHGRGDGSVELTGVQPPRDGRVVLQVAGRNGFLEQPFELTSEPVQELAVPPAGAAGTLTGRAVDASGAPLPGARIRLASFRGFEQSLLLTADRSGGFVANGLRPGPCVIEVLGSRRSQVVQVEADADNQVEVSLQ